MTDMTDQGRASGSLSIMMVAHSHFLGGMERHVVALSNVMAEHGHRVCFAGPMDGWGMRWGRRGLVAVM